MDVNLTPDLSSTISALGQYYPMQGTTEQGGAGASMAGMLGGGDAMDYSGQFADIRGLVDKGLGQITNLQQASTVLGGQVNAFSGTLTNVQNQIGGINSQTADLQAKLAAQAQGQSQIQQGLTAATTQLGTMGTSITGLQTGMTGLQAADTSQMAYMQRLGAAIEKIKAGIKV